ncbi:MAG: TM2 domain-containing protein, partial [Bacillota bacterium]
MEEIKDASVAQQSTPVPGELEPAVKKFCKHCGERIDVECVVCPKCGKQVEQLKQDAPQPSVVIHNTSTNTNLNQNTNRTGIENYPYKSKMTALLLCFFLGVLGVHRFYVGKMGTGIIW